MNPIPKSFIPSIKDKFTTKKKNRVLWNGTSRGFFSIALIAIIVGTIAIGLIGFLLITKMVSDTPEEVPGLIKEDEMRPAVDDETKASTPDVKKSQNIEKETETVVAPKLSSPATESPSDLEAVSPSITVEAPTEISPSPPVAETTSCATTVKPQFTADITDFSKIKIITAPSTNVIAGPKGFSYISTGRNRVPVYAPTALTLHSGIYRKETIESTAYYELTFTAQENCNYSMTYKYIDEIVAPVAEQIESTPTVGESPAALARNTILLEAGDLIGYTKGTPEEGRWGFGMYHSKEKGILAAEQNFYDTLGYSVCWTDFYVPTIKKQHYRNLLEGPQLVCEF